MMPLMRLKLCLQYMYQRCNFAGQHTLQHILKSNMDQPASKDLFGIIMKTLFTKRMTYLLQSKGLEMDPIVSPHDTLLVRRLPLLASDLMHKTWMSTMSNKPWLKPPRPVVNVGDIVVLEDPLDSDKLVVRKLAAAAEGYEMVSTDEDDEPFALGEDQAWVISANTSLTAEESKDSRTYGPVSMSAIFGRVIYRFRSLEDGGVMANNIHSMNWDMPVLYMEMKTEEILRFTDEQNKKKQEFLS